MKFSLRFIAAVVGLVNPLLSQADVISRDDADALIVIDGAADTIQPGPADFQSASTSDSAKLLENYLGVSLYGAGGISSLPAIHGMADDRVRVQVDGMDLMPSCPNHMNSPLSVIDPGYVGSVSLIAGITPVSAGGDSLAGTIRMNGPQPEFATDPGQVFTRGQVGTFYRSNGDAHGANLSATYANDWFNLTYNGSVSQSNDISAARDFKSAGYAAPGRGWLAGNVIGSTAYKTENNQLGVALRHDKNLLEFSASLQDVPYEWFPNQRMDMTKNLSKQFNLHYFGQFQWGELDARVFEQLTSHAMDFGTDKQFQYGAAAGMPMDTEGKTRGLTVRGTLPVSEKNSVNVGADYLNYRLNDWWPPATASTGMMGPSVFQNVNNGERNRLGLFAELNTQWNSRWFTQIGLRSERVSMTTGDVQGYNTTPMYASDAATFNSQAHQRTDHMTDFTAVARLVASERQEIAFGYAEKNRAPNLYERYTWSALNMAAIMNNFVGDGNGYIGNQQLRSETAHIVSATWDLHDPDQKNWQFKFTPYYTYLTNFIDAQRCPLTYSTNCSAANLSAATGFVTLQYVNQTAQIYGADLSGFVNLGRAGLEGNFMLTGLVNTTHGENLSTGDNLYNIMPLNAKFGLVRTANHWTTTLEWQLVAAKSQVSAVRNEIRTGGYGLLNLRNQFQWKRIQIELGVENLLNRFYAPPLAGAYTGQGTTMGINTIPWNVPVPGAGRSVNAAFKLEF